MTYIPNPIKNTAAEFDGLPGVGPRAALRYAYWLVRQPKEKIKRFAQALLALSESVIPCSVCGLWADKPVCSICSNPERDRTLLCIAATSQDVHVIEDAGVYRGLYHVFGGTIDPIEGRTAETLRVKELIQRLRTTDYGLRTINEVILAFDPDVNGDTTALYLMKQLATFPVTITRIARGLPTGAQIEYADSRTLGEAFSNRRKT